MPGCSFCGHQGLSEDQGDRVYKIESLGVGGTGALHIERMSMSYKHACA